MTNSQAGAKEQNELNVLKDAHSSFHSRKPIEPGAILLERYKVIKLLGSGGMGSVYHVQHLHLQSNYALKVLDAQSSDSNWRRFENEARAANRLDHPNLIKVHDSGLLPDGQPFFVMEMVPGITLGELLKKKGRLPVLPALNIFIQVGFALAYAHENGVIHRDLKPSNIMLVESSSGSMFSSVKVVDLGIAKLTGVDEFNQQTLTRTGEIFGSPLYMSPEQCLGIPVDQRADLYSLGCVMYETLTGAPPVMGDSALSTMMKHQSEKPLSLREASLGTVFPNAIEQLVAKLLEKDPNNRFPNAQFLTANLVNIQQELQEKRNDDAAEIVQSVLNEKNVTTIFSTRNIVAFILIIFAYGLGLLTGHLTVQNKSKAKANPNVEKAAKVLPDGMRAVPRETDYLLEGKAPSGEDPYLGTGSGPFSRQISKSEVEFTFPSNLSIGKIASDHNYVDDKSFVQARGKVKLPAGLFIFRAATELFMYPNLMEKFRPNELSHLTLKQCAGDSKILLSKLDQQKNLHSLDLAGTPVRDQQFESVKQMPKLEQLWLTSTGTSASAIVSLPRLKNLRTLDISEMRNARLVLNALRGSKKLTSLRLKQCNLVPEDLRIASEIPNLTDLDICANPNINDDALKLLMPLKKLNYLNVERCSITPACAKTLQHMPITLLQVDTKTFDEAKLADLKERLPHIRVTPVPNRESEMQTLMKNIGE